jgi:hypothetical protein
VKVVFLDIDGVLNSHAWFARPSREPGTLGRLDPEPVARVERLCAETGAVVVVTSTLRLLHDVRELTGLLRTRGFTHRVLDFTPDIEDRRGRGDEIQRWLESARGKKLEGIAILDDEEKMFHLDPWLVRTSYETGLLDAHVEEAKRVLERPFSRDDRPRRRRVPRTTRSR